MRIILLVFLTCLFDNNFIWSQTAPASVQENKPGAPDAKKPDPNAKPASSKIVKKIESPPSQQKPTYVYKSTPKIDLSRQYPNGQVKEKGDSLDGFKHGRWTQFDMKGRKSGFITYSKGIKEGDFEFYFESGALKEKGRYLNDKLDGELITYYVNGKESSKKRFNAGVPEGQWVYYYENGTIKKQENYVNGKLDGPYLENYENGKQKVAANFVNGKLEGSYTSYYPSGSEKRQGSYLNGKKTGEWVFMDEEGKVLYKKKFGTSSKLPK